MGFHGPETPDAKFIVFTMRDENFGEFQLEWIFSDEFLYKYLYKNYIFFLLSLEFIYLVDTKRIITMTEMLCKLVLFVIKILICEEMRNSRNNACY